jgi:uncharacterized protein (DUF3084 family)
MTVGVSRKRLRALHLCSRFRFAGIRFLFMARRMLSSVAQQAKDLRQQLKAVFPLCKFRVRSSNYSMGSSIRVSWMDGPMVSEVEAIANRYESIRRDEGSGEILSGGNRYVHCERRFSIAVFEAAVMTVCRDWGVELVPTVVCGPSEFSSPHIPHEANPQRCWRRREGSSVVGDGLSG